MRLSQILRRLARVRVFTVVAAATLAIGIGANSAIFSLVDGIVLKPLPYPRADELIVLDHDAPGIKLLSAGAAPFLYFTYRDEARTFDHIGIWRSSTATVTGLAEPEEVRIIRVSDGVLPSLGVSPLIGRSFNTQDDSPGSPETAILMGGYWRTRFGGDESVIGRRIVLDGRPRDIVGVMPDTFRFLDEKAALITPLQLNPTRTFLGNFSFSGLARLKPGATPTDANADAARMIALALERFPAIPGFSARVFRDARLMPAIRPLKLAVIGDVGAMLWVLMGTIGLVLLIACANVANLLLVRVEGRQQELAIKAALGASRRRLSSELLLESMTLGALGGVAGLGLSYAALRIIVALAPASLPRMSDISIDARVLAFTAAISVIAGLLFGSAPVIKYVGPRIHSALHGSPRTHSAGRDRHHGRRVLVIVQVALALVLLVGSGLMIRTFLALRDVRPGFIAPGHIQTFRVSIPPSQAGAADAAVRMEQAIVDRIARIPGVSAVGLTSRVPMIGSGWRDPVFLEDAPPSDTSIAPLRSFKMISPGLFGAMGNAIIAGRDLTWTDVYDKRPVAIVSENLARELWGMPSAALGKRIHETANSPLREIVGVVSDERDDGVDKKAPSIVCWPILMSKFEGEEPWVQRSVSFMIRSARTGSTSFTTELSQAVWSVNPDLPLANMRTMQEVYDTSLARTSFALALLAISGVMALLLGLAGIYAVTSHAVSTRTREIGIRIALGARADEVTWMFVRYGASMAAIGIAAGLGAAVALTRAMSSLVFDVAAIDPLTYGAVSLGLLAVAGLASYVPALRAASVEPLEALRAE